MKQVSEYEILTALSNVAAAIGAMDTVSEFVDQRTASVIRKYRSLLANTIDGMQKWLEDD